MSAQGELFRACRRRPSSALPISTPGPLVWRAPEGPKCLAAVPTGRRQGQHGLAGLAPDKFRTSFPTVTFRNYPKTSQFQRYNFNIKRSLWGITCEIAQTAARPALHIFACNSIGPNFNKPRKRWNSNDTTSISKEVSGELHAKLMIDSQNWTTCSNPGPGQTTNRRTEQPGTQQAHR